MHSIATVLDHGYDEIIGKGIGSTRDVVSGTGNIACIPGDNVSDTGESDRRRGARSAHQGRGP